MKSIDITCFYFADVKILFKKKALNLKCRNTTRRKPIDSNTGAVEIPKSQKQYTFHRHNFSFPLYVLLSYYIKKTLFIHKATTQKQSG